MMTWALVRHATRLAAYVLAFLLLLAPENGASGATPTAPLPFMGRGDHRFGVVEGYQAPELAIRSGASWQRANFWWNEFQPGGPNDWKETEAHVSLTAIDETLASGQEVVGLIGNPPAWATRNGSVPANLDRPLNDPANHWARFVDRLMRAYQGRVNTWIIWNEPDIPPDFSGSTWAGSPKEYYLLLKTAYQVAKAVSPEIRVLFAGTTYWGDVWNNRRLFVERTLEQAQSDPTAKANGFYFDALPLHLYNSPYDIPKVAGEYRTILQRFGLSKPLWLTETNLVPKDDPTYPLTDARWVANMEDQAAFVVQAYALALAANLERISVYKLVDGTVFNGEPYGMARNDGTVRPAYRAYQVAAALFSQASQATYRNADGVAIVTLTQPGKQTSVLWASSKSSATTSVPAVGSRARLVTHVGEETALTPQAPGGAYRVSLGAARHDFLGGPPLILVQEGVSPGLLQGDGRLLFPATGTAASPRFAEAYFALGGLAVFGRPLGDEEALPDRVVQRFERGRLQYFPALAGTPLAVQPGDEKRLPTPADDPLYFAPTRQRVSPLFADFFRRNGAVETFGYPRTAPQARNGLFEQHFQRAVLEYLPEFEGTPRAIRIRPLGQQLTQARAFALSLRPASADTQRQYFPETGHSVGLGFLKYFRSRGGVAVFGLPLSGEIEEVNSDGSGRTYTVQYFQNARFEFHPELAGTRYEVQLGLLGDQVLRASGLLKD